MAPERCHVNISCLFPNPSEFKRGWCRYAIQNHCHYGRFSSWNMPWSTGIAVVHIYKQDSTGEARNDERASLVVSFVIPDTTSLPLWGLIDTGSGVSTLTFSAYNGLTVHTEIVSRSYRVDLIAPNGKTNPSSCPRATN